MGALATSWRADALGVKKTVIVATDGSAINNPKGPAGWAWFVDESNWGAGAFSQASNQVAEIFAVLAALRAIPSEYAVLVRSDSQFTINVATKWMRGWKAKGWRKADGNPPENLSLVKELDVALAGRDVRFEWVRGHSGDRMNEIADRICGAAARATKDGKPVTRGPGWTSYTAPSASALAPVAGQGRPAVKAAARPAAKAPGRRATPSAGRRAVLRGRDGSKTVLERVPSWDEDDSAPRYSPRAKAAPSATKWCPSCDGPINPITAECRCSFSGG